MASVRSPYAHNAEDFPKLAGSGKLPPGSTLYQRLSLSTRHGEHSRSNPPVKPPHARAVHLQSWRRTQSISWFDDSLTGVSHLSGRLADQLGSHSLSSSKTQVKSVFQTHVFFKCISCDLAFLGLTTELLWDLIDARHAQGRSESFQYVREHCRISRWREAAITP